MAVQSQRLPNVYVTRFLGDSSVVVAAPWGRAIVCNG